MYIHAKLTKFDEQKLLTYLNSKKYNILFFFPRKDNCFSIILQVASIFFDNKVFLQHTEMTSLCKTWKLGWRHSIYSKYC